MEAIRDRESDITKERILMLLRAGANVVLTTKVCELIIVTVSPPFQSLPDVQGIDDMALKYFVECGAIAVRRVAKEDLRRIAKATGGQILLSLADMDGNETIDPSCFGEAEAVSEEKVIFLWDHPLWVFCSVPISNMFQIGWRWRTAIH